ncbi:hypothetical protein [Aeromonas phage phiA014L]|uniref:Uncharacterized protein n=1 Tax=Aeromonas phage phiA014L TaxID=3119844 RepID=A0ABZ2CMW2_9CAUD
MKLWELYKKGGQALHNRGDGYTGKHMAYRAAACLYCLPAIVGEMLRQGACASYECATEIYDYIRFNH